MPVTNGRALNGGLAIPENWPLRLGGATASGPKATIHGMALELVDRAERRRRNLLWEQAILAGSDGLIHLRAQVAYLLSGCTLARSSRGFGAENNDSRNGLRIGRLV